MTSSDRSKAAIDDVGDPEIGTENAEPPGAYYDASDPCVASIFKTHE
jgi:hypothetical protein